MAYFTESSYGKYIELQNVSGSGDPTDAPVGGIYLFASGTSDDAGESRLYLQNQGGVVTDVAKAIDIDAFDALGSAALHQTQDHFLFSDNGTEKKITFSNLQDAVFADVSGDATVAAGGALTIAANAVEGSMLNTNAISGQTEMTGDLADTDELMISDDGVLKRADFSVVRDAVFADVSGDATIAAGGALTIAAQAVENSMLADDAVGADELAANAVVNASIAANAAIDMDKLDGGSLASSLSDLAQGDLMYAGDVDDSNNLKSITFSDFEDAIFGNVSGDATIAAGGALTIAVGAVEHAMLAGDAVDGDNIADDSVNSEHIVLGALDAEHYASGSIQGGHVAQGTLGAENYATGSIQSNHLAGSVANAKLANSSVTLTQGAGMASLGAVSLGGSIAIAVDGVLEDLDTLGAASADGEFIVATGAGAFAYESGNTARTSLGLGTGDSPAFASLQVSDLTQGRLVLAGASGELADNANLQFDGTNLALAGNMSGSGNFQIDGNAIIGGSGTSAFSGSVYVASSVTADSMSLGGGYGGGSGLTITNAGRLQMNENLTVDGTAQVKSALTIGADGAGVNATFHGAAANEVMRYDAANHVLQFKDSSDASMLTIGGDATSEYAIDVVNGSNNINKVRAAAFVTYSDESLKQDVASMRNTALDTVMSLEGVEFTWNDSGERDFGFIAQDVQAVLPKAVHVAEDGVQGVDYSRLTSVLVEAVKAQQVQIEDLKKALKK